MPPETLVVRPFSNPRQVLAPDGRVLSVPSGWGLLPPGDAALSRRIKKDGPTWTVIEMKGRKRFSRGIWAPADRIEALRGELAVKRQDPAYQRQLDAGRRRREAAQEVYVEDFQAAVRRFLNFHPKHGELAARMAERIAAHATPVGSGTVARTERLPLERRAEAATLAWMRHQTTAYDHMAIPRVRGRRREVRRELAEGSVRLLDHYRGGWPIAPESCPLQLALGRVAPVGPGSGEPPAWF